MEPAENTVASKKASGSRPYKRRVRNILIHKPMQREFTFVMVALLMVSTLAIGYVIHETMREAALGGGFRFGKINPYEVLSEVSYQLILRISCILFATLVVIGIFGVFFLHRVAGPVYRFRQIFMRINDGEMPLKFKLREGDFFSETAAEINRLLVRLKFEKDKKDRIRKKLESLLNSGQVAETLRSEVQELKRCLDEESGEA